MSKTIIAGPCSVESQAQLREVTLALKAMPEVSTIRAGVWKPRTRPGAFEGLGEPALGWMRDLSAELGVHYCCEVARPEHVELCLQYGIDTLWLGARTTTNPFMVDELCQALRGSSAHLLVKNPVCPDVRLWIGALERLHKAGIGHLTAVHRGFSMYNNHGYRNAPLWEVAMELRREHPELPILCDPSHMGGSADLIAPLARAAHQLDYDGLMVEVHPHPADALTDAPQQITPQTLAAVIADWATAPHPSSATNAAQALEPLRRKIDDIDHELVSLLSQRMAVSKRIASVKRDAHLPVYQQARWADVVNDRLHQATALGLDADFTKDLLEKIHAESVRVQLED
ncbi:MAG: bifunctional 3-deoxy-7-phosphoheptulonate synthase/chorismate mutase type II [Bacteroidales bacterium]|nr:bifunctional 3-deoxy-7-phosphoheptulonate synthase/chorismate mutase type II [Bacteroidales bacterium]